MERNVAIFGNALSATQSLVITQDAKPKNLEIVGITKVKLVPDVVKGSWKKSAKYHRAMPKRYGSKILNRKYMNLFKKIALNLVEKQLDKVDNRPESLVNDIKRLCMERLYEKLGGEFVEESEEENLNPINEEKTDKNVKIDEMRLPSFFLNSSSYTIDELAPGKKLNYRCIWDSVLVNSVEKEFIIRGDTDEEINNAIRFNLYSGNQENFPFVKFNINEDLFIKSIYNDFIYQTENRDYSIDADLKYDIANYSLKSIADYGSQGRKKVTINVNYTQIHTERTIVFKILIPQYDDIYSMLNQIALDIKEDMILKYGDRNILADSLKIECYHYSNPEGI